MYFIWRISSASFRSRHPACILPSVSCALQCFPYQISRLILGTAAGILVSIGPCVYGHCGPEENDRIKVRSRKLCQGQGKECKDAEKTKLQENVIVFPDTPAEVDLHPAYYGHFSGEAGSCRYPDSDRCACEPERQLQQNVFGGILHTNGG